MHVKKVLKKKKKKWVEEKGEGEEKFGDVFEGDFEEEEEINK